MLLTPNESVLDVKDKIFVYENEELSNKLELAFREHFAKSFRMLGGKAHVSSLTYCLRKEALKSHLVATKKRDPLEFIDIWTAMNFIRGLVSEYAVTKVLRNEIDPQKDLNFEDKVIAHPDGVTKDNTAIIEMKNNNTYEALVLGDKSLYSYFRQTVYYMVMSDIEIGHVIVIYGLPMHVNKSHFFNSRTYYTVDSLKKIKERPFKIFTLNLAKHSHLRAKIKDGMRKQHAHINQFQDYKDENVIKHFPRLDTYPDDWKCKYCEVVKECKKIEPEYIQDNVNLVDILLNKLIDDNILNIAK